MRTFKTVARDRGVTTIPLALRDAAAVRADTELTWVEIEPQLWLVGPRARHPEQEAPVVAAALAKPSPFPKLMQRLAEGRLAPRQSTDAGRDYHPSHAPALTEEQMIALGAPAVETPRRRRGRR